MSLMGAGSPKQETQDPVLCLFPSHEVASMADLAGRVPAGALRMTLLNPALYGVAGQRSPSELAAYAVRTLHPAFLPQVGGWESRFPAPMDALGAVLAQAPPACEVWIWGGESPGSVLFEISSRGMLGFAGVAPSRVRLHRPSFDDHPAGDERSRVAWEPVSDEPEYWSTRAWEAISSSLPAELSSLLCDGRAPAEYPAALSIVASRYPSATNGLSFMEERLLHMASDHDGEELHRIQGRAISLFDDIGLPRHPLDYADAMSGLLRVGEGGSLVRLDGMRVGVTAAGLQVIAGQRTRWSVNLPDYYVGGVRIHSAEPAATRAGESLFNQSLICRSPSL